MPLFKSMKYLIMYLEYCLLIFRVSDKKFELHIPSRGFGFSFSRLLKFNKTLKTDSK